MADQQPADATRADRPPVTDPTLAGEPSTTDLAPRWSGAAAVPARTPTRRWLRRRRALGADQDDWDTPPAVDPWAGSDLPWDPTPLPPSTTDLPPTLRGPALPPTLRGPALPPTLRGPALPPTLRGPALPPTLRGPAPPVPRDRAPVAPRPTPAYRPPPHLVPAYRPPSHPVPANWPPPARPRRKRRWLRNLSLFTLLSIGCCVGVPAYYAWPAVRQYPVNANLPRTVADLHLRDDEATQQAAARLAEQLRDRDFGMGDAFAGVYTDGYGKRVTVFGVTGLRLTPAADVAAEVDHLSSTYSVPAVHPFDLGETGAYERCGAGAVDGRAVVMCAWADHGSLAVVLMNRRSLTDSANLTGILRAAVLSHA